MSVAAESYRATFTIVFVAAKEIADIAGYRSVPNRCRFIENIPHNIGSIRLATDKARTWEKVTVCSTRNNAFGYMATCLSVTLPRQAEFQFILNRPQIERNILLLAFKPKLRQFVVFTCKDIELLPVHLPSKSTAVVMFLKPCA